ncbi:hypothetical protein LT493_31765 [Streptomyces tricolor]|nr:hypothetical protein [Streptomyces tricolor]
MELASRGYVVVTVDHTHETTPVEFPNGRVELQKEPMTGAETVKKAVETRVRDTRFVLDQLAVLRAGRNPDAEGRRLPRGLGGALDLDRIGMYGHSAGGITAAETMRADRRIDAGINMDGTLQYSSTEFLPVALEGLDRPFMLMGKANQTHLNKPSWQSFWDRSTGWKRDLNLGGGWPLQLHRRSDDRARSGRAPGHPGAEPRAVHRHRGPRAGAPQPSVPTSRRSSTSTC